VLLDLGHGLAVDQRASGGAFFQTVADLQLGHGGQLLGERVVDAVLDVQAVGADAGLAVVAVLGDDRAFDGLIQVGVVEHDERRVAAQFQETFLMSLAHSAISWRPISVEPVKDSLRTIGLLVSSPPMSPALPVTTLNTPGMPARWASSPGPGRRTGLRSRLEHHGATGGQGRAGFTGDHRGREVPRGDGGGHADRLLDHDQALVWLVARITSPCAWLLRRTTR
jgi:ParB family chromosome partitioning protein